MFINYACMSKNNTDVISDFVILFTSNWHMYFDKN